MKFSDPHIKRYSLLSWESIEKEQRAQHPSQAPWPGWKRCIQFYQKACDGSPNVVRGGGGPVPVCRKDAVTRG